MIPLIPGLLHILMQMDVFAFIFLHRIPECIRISEAKAEQVVFGLEFFPDRFADAPIGSGDHDDPLRVLFHCNSFCVFGEFRLNLILF